MKIDAILIDLDGTITDTERIYQKHWNIAAKELGYDFFTKEDALNLRSAWGPYAEKMLYDKYGDKLDFEKLHDLCAVNTRKELEEKGTPLKPHAKEFLEEVRKCNKKIVLVSSSKMETIKWRIAEVGLENAFDDVVSAHDMKRGKPYPEPYLYACDVINVKPENTIAIEDSPNGVYSAIAAGCNTIMVPDMTEADEELKSKLYGYAENLMEVLDILDV